MLSSRASMAVKPAVTGARLSMVRPSLAIRSVRARAAAPGGLDTEELKEKVQAFATDATAAIKAQWEKTEDKPAAVVVAVGTVVAASFALNVVNTVDKIPVVSDFVELVGIAVTGWFTYRYLTVGPDRDELFVTLKTWFNKVYGNKL
ncbi:hypothetical protein MNEG_12308 [Monoraphidium neglectum]|uniref:Cyanobacterial aminoacyl-tRNA synthetase CAAD domain-containing protein n=1 Tax=Monoraphidium neglectum TaxID=145388 RepID=A0A0D2LW11_9CHLO|nr:hypothetical protein MNEG_12308 [Monoraphidium neglectum]KIY95654.1 hypothetical protein MNEG_12308 [Monoraphidium neglectum]|eukprot:XP_013894674.1 hypothetical protein MNEG_12308 [Monoraphidium neglectum]